MIKTLSALALATLLPLSQNDCVGKPPPSKQEIQVIVREVCPKLRTLTPTQKLAIADALEKGPKSLGLDLLADDWQKMRDQIEACRKGKTG